MNQRGLANKPFIGVALLALVILIAALWLFASGQSRAAPRDEPILMPPAPAVSASLMASVLPRDSIPTIDAPQYTTSDEADEFMEAGEQVIGVVINGEARAFPLPILSKHEIVNDVIGGHPVTVTWCPLCFTALVFSRQLADRDTPLMFGVSGKLLNETLVMYDRQTNSLWSQLYGAAVDGPLSGERLAFFPSTLTQWSVWREQYPETMVLSKPLTCAQFDCGSYATNPRGSYDVDPYASYYISADEGVVNHAIPRDDESVPGRPKERVLGLRLADVARAYPFTDLSRERLVNDVIGGQPVLIWFDPDTSTGGAFLRTVDEETLTFSHFPDRPMKLIDEQTGSEWSALTGQATTGPLTGKQLAPLVVTPAFAFGWFGYFPDSDVYKGG